MPEPGLGGTPDYKYTAPGGLEKTAQETIGNTLANGTETPRGLASMGGSAKLILAAAALWYFWPKIKRML